MKNCPNCGAPIQNERCDYCGTIMYDFSCIDISSPCYVKIKVGGRILQAKMYVGDLRTSFSKSAIEARSMNGELFSIPNTEVRVDMELISVNGYDVVDG